MEGTAFILVRSVVANPDDRKAFDHWYHTDHIPLIFSKVANVNRAWRFWSKSDPAIHYSLGEFSKMSELQRAAMLPSSPYEGPSSDSGEHTFSSGSRKRA